MDILGNTTGGDVKIFRYWVQKVLPAVYDDSLTYYELLAKVIDKLNELINENNTTSDALNEFREIFLELQKEFEDFKEHGFDKYYAEQVAKWIMENTKYVLDTVIRQVYFGINLEGYFVAYIPDSWNDIQFDTGAVYELDTYGRLILRWDADSPYTVNQLPEIVR